MRVEFREWDNSVSSRRTATSLGRDEVQVWSAILCHDEVESIKLIPDLSADEHKRADRFLVEESRRQFIFSRAVLRQLLGACLNTTPSALSFCYHPHGKPFVYQSGLCFNLSHSGQLLVIALARGCDVGVDVEWLHGRTDWSLLAERIFSSRELRELRALPASKQREAFFNGWTRKEAYLKATGEGLTDDLRAIEVTLSPSKNRGCWALKLCVSGGSKRFPCRRNLRAQLPLRARKRFSDFTIFKCGTIPYVLVRPRRYERMCASDSLTTGAEPFFIMELIRLHQASARQIVESREQIRFSSA